MSVEQDTTSGADRRWEAFATREPYFAVLTAPQFLRANLTAHGDREFFAGGEQYVTWPLRVVADRLVPNFAPVTTLEYGCGVGRLPIPFARRAGRVTAIDRSPAMLQTARHEGDRQGVAHIEFQTPQALVTADRTFDLVYCHSVLQRLPPATGLSLLRSLVGYLRSGWVGVFQFPLITRGHPGWWRLRAASGPAYLR